MIFLVIWIPVVKENGYGYVIPKPLPHRPSLGVPRDEWIAPEKILIAVNGVAVLMGNDIAILPGINSICEEMQLIVHRRVVGVGRGPNFILGAGLGAIGVTDAVGRGVSTGKAQVGEVVCNTRSMV